MDQKKPRILEVRVDLGEPMVLTGMSPPGEPLRFYGPDGEVVVPDLVEIGMSYSRGAAQGRAVIAS